jgi:hypothetical protein
MDALEFAREIGTPLNAHATIHWVGTNAGDDPDCQRFAKLREGFDKWLKRHGVPGGLTAIWVRERLSGGMAEVVHCHMLFHLAHPFFRGKKRLQVVRALERLIDRHGNGNYANYPLKLTSPSQSERSVSPEGWRTGCLAQIWSTTRVAQTAGPRFRQALWHHTEHRSSASTSSLFSSSP